MNSKTSPSSIPTESISAPPLFELARAIFQDWEKLRRFYNTILITVTFLISGIILTSKIKVNTLSDCVYLIVTLITVSLIGAVIANLCFFAGPILELYSKWIRFNFHFPRYLLFVAGTIFASFLALCALIETSVYFIFL